jgi:hypothetical protein
VVVVGVGVVVVVVGVGVVVVVGVGVVVFSIGGTAIVNPLRPKHSPAFTAPYCSHADRASFGCLHTTMDAIQ